MPLVSRTRQTFLSPEFGFLGVTVKTLRQTPLLKGERKLAGLFFFGLKPNFKAGILFRFPIFFLPFFIN